MQTKPQIKTQQQEQYKETELGLLPKDWEVVRLGNYCGVSSGGSAPQGKKYFNGDKPFIRVQHIDNEEFLIKNCDLITEQAVKDYKLKLFSKGTIVFPKSGASVYLEKRAVLPFDAYIVSHLCAVNSKNKNLSQKFLFYFLRSRKLAQKKADGYPTLNLSEVKNIKIPLPPLPEQKRIAFVLSTIQTAKEKTEQVIAAARELKKSLMKHLFTYGAVSLKEAENVKLKDTEIGEIPEGWEVVRLGDVAKTFSGGTPSRKNKKYWGGKIPWAKSGELNDNRINKIKESITEEGLKNSSAKYVEIGTLLIAMYGATAGKVGIAKSKFTINQAICAIVPNNSFDAEFYFYYLIYIRNKLLSQRFGGAQPN